MARQETTVTSATSSSASSPNGETDMNDIDIEEGRRLAAAATVGFWHHEAGQQNQNIARDGRMWGVAHNVKTYDAALIVWLRNNAAAMFDAIETGRQWKTIARRRETTIRRSLGYLNAALDNSRIPMACWSELIEARGLLERDLAERTPS